MYTRAMKYIYIFFLFLRCILLSCWTFYLLKELYQKGDSKYIKEHILLDSILFGNTATCIAEVYAIFIY